VMEMGWVAVEYWELFQVNTTGDRTLHWRSVGVWDPPPNISPPAAKSYPIVEVRLHNLAVPV
jgi:hypothetical protein